MKYSTEIIKEICGYIEEGNTQRDAAYLAGINKDTFYEWMKTKSEFSDSIKKAELICKRRNIAIIQNAAEKTWQAAAWFLERRYKNEYSTKTESKINMNIPQLISIVENEEQRKLLENE